MPSRQKLSGRPQTPTLTHLSDIHESPQGRIENLPQPGFTMNRILLFPFAIFCGHSQVRTRVTEQRVFSADGRKDHKVAAMNFLLHVCARVLKRNSN